MFRELVGLPSERQPDNSIDIGKVPHGLNTYEPADRLSPTEASKLINWIVEKGGKKVPRLPIALYSNSATTNAITYMKRVDIGGTDYELVIDSGFRLYYLDGSLDPTLIGTLEGDATVLNYNGIVILFDGSYIKYIEDVSTIKIAYDSGSYQYNNLSASNNISLAVGDAVNTRVAQKFTTQAWTAGYTIPPFGASFYLSRTGTGGAATIFAEVRSVAGDFLKASFAITSSPANDISTTMSLFSIEFDTLPGTFLASTDYYLSIRSTGADGANYVNVGCNVVTSGGLAYTYNGAYNVDTAKNLVCNISPSRPPKGSYGVAWNNRPWVWGDPDNLGVMHYGNLSHLDWSTSNGGGSLGIVDDSGDAYEIGAAEPFWNDLYVFGKQNQPYMVKISGTEPDNYSQNVIFNEPWTVPLGIVNSVNELWFINGNGASPVAGVQEFGDLRTQMASQPIYDRIKDNWDSSTAFAGYYPRDGQLWFVMPTYNRIMVCHVKLGVPGPDGQSIRYPWAEYELYWHDLTSSTYKWVANGTEYYLQIAAGGDPSISAQPDFVVMDGAKLTEGTAGSLSDHEWDYAQDPGTSYNTIYVKDDTGDPDTSGVDIKTVFLPTCMEQSGSNMLFGSSDKFIYKINAAATEYTDMGTVQVSPEWASAWIELPGGYAEFNKIQAMMSAEVAPSATELTSNGEFTTNYADWTAGGSPTVTGGVNSAADPGSASGGSDNACVKIVSTGDSSTSLRQNITVEAKKSYTITCRAYVPSANIEALAASLQIWGKNAALLSVFLDTDTVAREDGWVNLTTTVTPHDAQITVYLFCLGSTSGDIVYFDKVSCIRETAFSSVDINVFLNRQYTDSTGTITIQLPETSTEQQEQLFEYISFIGWSIMIETDNISMSSPIFDDGLRLWFRALST